MSGIDGIEQAIIHFFEQPELSAIGNAIGIIGGIVAFAKFLVSGINCLIHKFLRSKESATKGIPSKKFLRVVRIKLIFHSQLLKTLRSYQISLCRSLMVNSSLYTSKKVFDLYKNFTRSLPDGHEGSPLIKKITATTLVLNGIVAIA